MFAASKTKQVSSAANYVEEVFSTYLYTGNGSTQTITNNIDLSTKGGLVWQKSRSNALANVLSDTARGVQLFLESNDTGGQSSNANSLTSFNVDGFSFGSLAKMNTNAATYVSWTFRKQPKFFDVVTWTGDGTGARTISHSLGSAPGCMFVKRTDTTQDWSVYHRALTTPATDELYLNRAYAANTGVSTWNSTNPTSTTFSVDSTRNANGGTFVAYLFAHNAGGFGLTGTDNVITCGGFTSGASDTFVSLGYEPQFVLWKNVGTEDWRMFDNMRGVPTGGNDAQLKPNTAGAEDSSFQFINFNSTGFTYEIAGGNPSQTYVYIAIRRGPMKVPTDATTVFSPQAVSTSSPGTTLTTNFPVDMVWPKNRAGFYNFVLDRLRGSSRTASVVLNTGATSAESSLGFGFGLDSNVSVYDNFDYQYVGSGNYAYWMFKRAPSFFDEVCYDGTGATATQITHNLGATPEMMIIKSRNTGSTSWVVYNAGVNGGVNPQNYYMLLQSTQAQTALTAMFNDTAPTSSVFTVGPQGSVGASGRTYVAYLFATCPGVSKVGSYTGNATLRTIDCGFTGGARFVMIKSVDQASDWLVWDTARGMVAGTDPSLSLNTTAAEANYNNVYTIATGFQIPATPDFGINNTGEKYIYLAIA